MQSLLFLDGVVQVLSVNPELMALLITYLILVLCLKVRQQSEASIEPIKKIRRKLSN